MLALLFLLACAPKAAPPAVPAAPEERMAAPKNTPSGAMLPTPHTADQLRSALTAGTELKFRIVAPGAPPVIQHWVFLDPTAEGVTIKSEVLGEDGSLIQDDGKVMHKWEDLREHAAFPAAATTRSEATVTVPAGTFTTWHYDVKDVGEGGVPIIKRFDFDPAHPGPPVKMVVESNGTILMSMELLSRTP